MAGVCEDNRFEIITKVKEHLIKATNIEMQPEELKYADSILFRLWQLGYFNQSELEKENAELKTKVTALENANRAMVKELDDMTSGGVSVLKNIVRSKEQLTKAKELLIRFLMASVYFNGKETDLIKEAEQFLKELEK